MSNALSGNPSLLASATWNMVGASRAAANVQHVTRDGRRGLDRRLTKRCHHGIKTRNILPVTTILVLNRS